MEKMQLFYILVLGYFFSLVIWFLTDPRDNEERMSNYFSPRVTTSGALVLLSIYLQWLYIKNYSHLEIPGGLFTIITGIATYIAGWIIAVWAKLTMQSNWGSPAQHDISRQTEIVTTGPYAFSRNPIYLGLILMAVGFFLALQSYLVVLSVLVFLIFRYAISKEEPLLEHYFGEKYIEYKKRVRKFI